ncbi:MAG: hypothetical protein ACRDDZ_07725 [Marinifilaceae bacterium]
MKLKLLLIAFVLFSTSVLSTVVAQSYPSIHIYGKCKLMDGRELTGFITTEWKHNLWVASFWPFKATNESAKYFYGNTRIHFGPKRSFSPQLHMFSCRYRDLSKQRPITDDVMEVTFRNGETMQVLYNKSMAMGIHTESGFYNLRWNQIVELEYFEAPSNAKVPFEKPIFARVESIHGIYEGMVLTLNVNNIQQRTISGMDGMTLDDLLDATRRDPSYPLTRLKGNLYVYMPSFGHVRAPWSKIVGITRIDAGNLASYSYNANVKPKALIGSVTTNNDETFKGPMAYNLDATYNFEMLVGKNEEIQYDIVFDQISSITPLNYTSSIVNLRNGGKVILGDLDDVNGYNEGIMLLNELLYIQWKDVRTVKFE